MFVAILKLDLHIPMSNSLKHKRMVLNSFKSKIRNNFNVSVAEVDNSDKWQRAKVAISHISSEKAHMLKVMEKLLNFVEAFNGVELLNHEIEVL